MNIAVIQISEAGSNIAKTLQRELGAKTIQRADVGRLLLTSRTNTKIPLWYVWIVLV